MMNKADYIINTFKQIMKRHDHLTVIYWKYNYEEQTLKAMIAHKNHDRRFLPLFKFDATIYDIPSDWTAMVTDLTTRLSWFIHFNKLDVYGDCKTNVQNKIGNIKRTCIASRAYDVYIIKCHKNNLREYFIYSLFGGYGKFPSAINNCINFEITSMDDVGVMVDAYIDISEKEGTINFIDNSWEEE